MKNSRRVISAALTAALFLFSVVPAALGATGNAAAPGAAAKLTGFKRPGASLPPNMLDKFRLVPSAGKAAPAKQAFNGLNPDAEVSVIIKLSQPPAVKPNKTGSGGSGSSVAPKPALSRQTIGAQRVDSNQVQAVKTQQQKVLNNLKSAGVQISIKRQFTNTFNGYAAEIKLADLDKIAAEQDVVAIYPDRQVQAMEEDAIQAMAAANVQAPDGGKLTGAGVLVAVIDTGVDYSHPDLGGGWSKKVIGGYDFVNGDADPMDDEGHGTHVAGIIAGLPDANNPAVAGVAPDARLLAYKVLDSSGYGWDSDVIAGIDQAVVDGANIMNLSLGSPNGFPDDPSAAAIDAAAAAGVIPVVSAGNSGPDYGDMMGTVGSPGTAAGAVTVAASDNHPSYPAVNFTVNSYTVDDTGIVLQQPLELTGFVMANSVAAITDPSELVDCGLGNSPAEFLGPDGKSKVAGKIALIGRGAQPFVTKLTNAKNAGAVAAIVYNVPSQDVPYPVILGDDPALAPGVGVLPYSQGRMLKDLLKNQPDADHPVTVTFGAAAVLPNPLNDTITSFSSRGLLPNYDLKPDVAAPGSNVLSLAPGGKYATMSGTSMAAPNVAGVMALLVQGHPGVPVDSLKVAVMNTARDLGYDAAAQGAGLVQAGQANQLVDAVYTYRNSMGYQFATGNLVFGAAGVDNNLGAVAPDGSKMTWVQDPVNGLSAIQKLTIAPLGVFAGSNMVQVSVGPLAKMSGGRLGEPISNPPVSLLLNDTALGATPVEVTVQAPETALAAQLRIQDLKALEPGDYQMVLNVQEPDGMIVHVPVVFSVPVADIFRNAAVDYPYISPNWAYSGEHPYAGLSFDVEQDLEALAVDVFDLQGNFVGVYFAADLSTVALWQQQGYVLGNLNRGKYWIPFDGIIMGDDYQWRVLPDGQYRLKIAGVKRGGYPDKSGDWVDYGDIYYGTPGALVVDTQSPDINLTSPPLACWKTTESTQPIGGTASDPNFRSITLNGQALAVDDNGGFAQTVVLSPGKNQFGVAASDLAGNVNSFGIELEYVTGTIVPVTAVSIDPVQVTLPRGNMMLLTATVAPADATIRQVIWSTDNPDVVKVGQDGMIWAKQPGTAKITATSSQDPSVFATSTVTVPPDPPHVLGEPRFVVGQLGDSAGVYLGLNALVDSDTRTAIPDNQIAGYQIVMHYNPAKVKVLDVKNTAGASTFITNEVDYLGPVLQQGPYQGVYDDPYQPGMKHLVIVGAKDSSFEAKNLAFVSLQVQGSTDDAASIWFELVDLSDVNRNHLGVPGMRNPINLSRGHVINDLQNAPSVADAVGALQYIVGKDVPVSDRYKEINPVNLASIDADYPADLSQGSAIKHVIALMQFLAKLRDANFAWYPNPGTTGN